MKEATIVEISEGGAKVVIDGAGLREGEQVEINISGLQTPIKAHVLATHHGRLSVQFTDGHTNSEFVGLISTLYPMALSA